MSIFSERLRELREINSLSMKELAKIIKVSDCAISNWENEINEPKASYLLALSSYFSCSVDYLLGLEDDFGNIVIAGESDGLTEEEKELIKCYRSSADAERLALITTARSFAKRKTDAKHSVG